MHPVMINTLAGQFSLYDEKCRRCSARGGGYPLTHTRIISLLCVTRVVARWRHCKQTQDTIRLLAVTSTPIGSDVSFHSVVCTKHTVSERYQCYVHNKER